MRSFQARLSEFDQRGIRVAAISVDSTEINHGHSRKIGCTFAFLSDVKAEVIRRYDLLHAGGGPHGSDISRPAEFLVDSSGVVRWRNLTESAAVRVRPQQVLDAFDQLIAKAAP